MNKKQTGFKKENEKFDEIEGTKWVVLVDEKDNPLGKMEKMKAHEDAKLHRAFSVFIHDGKGKVLLQRRAFSKYHSGGLLTNACCSHPRWEEPVIEGAKRRLQEELGIVCDLEFSFSFLYKAILDKGLTEHELDHVFVGVFPKGEIPFCEAEVDSVLWMDYEKLKKDIKENPQKYTVWFQIIMEKAEKNLQF